MIEQDLDSLLQKDNPGPPHGASYFLWGREQMRMGIVRCGEEKGWLNVLSLLLNWANPHVLHLVKRPELSLSEVSPWKEETGEKEACPLEQGWPAFCGRVWGPPLPGGSLCCHDYSPGLRILIRVYVRARPLLVVLTSNEDLVYIRSSLPVALDTHLNLHLPAANTWISKLTSCYLDFKVTSNIFTY